MIKVTLIICTLFILISCERVKIEQDVDSYKVCPKTYVVETLVWTYTAWGLSNTIEYMSYVYNVSPEQIDSVKRVEKEKAIPVYEKVKSCYP